jgi:glycosylphosphatidylinositol deacylase
MASLDGIVPPTNGLTIGAAGMVNVFLSTEHQSILWCNQVVEFDLCTLVEIYLTYIAFSSCLYLEVIICEI